MDHISHLSVPAEILTTLSKVAIASIILMSL